VEFDWDQGDLAKCRKHRVSIEEIEWVLSRPVAVYPLPFPKESRNFAIGKNSQNRYVFLVFTIRRKDGRDSIRPISARYMHRKEVEHYEKTQKASPAEDQ
jgi:uncharacterized DUF497 family protein